MSMFCKSEKIKHIHSLAGFLAADSFFLFSALRFWVFLGAGGSGNGCCIGAGGRFSGQSLTQCPSWPHLKHWFDVGLGLDCWSGHSGAQCPCWWQIKQAPELLDLARSSSLLKRMEVWLRISSARTLTLFIIPSRVVVIIPKSSLRRGDLWS